MSELNGDKSRFQLRRKAGLLRRQRSREVQASLRLEVTGRVASDDEQSGGARGRVTTLQLVRGGLVGE